MDKITQSKCYINNKWVDTKDTLPVIDPFTEKQVATCANADYQTIDNAVLAAHDALPLWKASTGAERAVFLNKIAEKIKENKQVLSELETVDCGKPFPESEWDMDDVAACFEYYAKLAIDLDAKQMQPVDVGDEEFACFMRYESAGVVGAIIPWNYPLLMAAWKVCPALAAGCTIVLKPSELTPLTAMFLGDILTEVGLPRGVVNIVFGTGKDAGIPLVRHPLVKKIAFTGSVPTGMNIMKGCADDVKSVSLELGGKSPAIVFSDADLVKAVEWVMFGCFWTNGQICSATSRLLVQENIADKFLADIALNVARIKAGNPMESDCRLGPLVSKQQQEKVQLFIEQAKLQGAQVVCGGSLQDKSKLPTGYFVMPTVLKVTKDMTIWNEEVFGPVLSVMTFKTEEEAIALANDSKYGLASAIFSGDDALIERVTPKLECGIVWQNCSQPAFCQLPWGGVKQTGMGRDLGEFGLNNFLEPKQIVRRVVKDPLGWYDMKSQL